MDQRAAWLPVVAAALDGIVATVLRRELAEYGQMRDEPSDLVLEDRLVVGQLPPGGELAPV